MLTMHMRTLPKQTYGGSHSYLTFVANSVAYIKSLGQMEEDQIKTGSYWIIR